MIFEETSLLRIRRQHDAFLPVKGGDLRNTWIGLNSQGGISRENRDLLDTCFWYSDLYTRNANVMGICVA